MTKKTGAIDRKQNGRRNFLRKAAGLLGLSTVNLLTAARQSAWAAGTDGPEKKQLTVGFIPLTDCASLIIAAAMKFDERYGIKIKLSKETSWAAIRDKLVSGELDAAHVLYSLVYDIQTGIGDIRQDMAILMTLNANGQAITLANHFREQHVTSGERLKQLIDARDREYTFAQTFPTGTHALWLYYWLASHGIDPLRHVRATTVPPQQMARHMQLGHLDGYCAGEPWNARAIADGTGFTSVTTQDIWKDHPEKVLGTTAAFADRHPHSARALIMALLDAARYIDATKNRPEVAAIIADAAYVDTSAEVIGPRFLGNYTDGLGRRWRDPHHLKFFDDGAVSYPWISDGMWMLTQHRRWGLLKADPDYRAVATKVHRLDLYSQAATQLNIAVPQQTMRSSKFIDGKTWDGSNPQAYAASFEIRA